MWRIYYTDQRSIHCTDHEDQSHRPAKITCTDQTPSAYGSSSAHRPMLGAVGSPIQIGGVSQTNSRIAITMMS